MTFREMASDEGMSMLRAALLVAFNLFVLALAVVFVIWVLI